MFSIDRSSSVPLQLQVMEQFHHHLHFGTVRESDRLPSIRDLAETLHVNPKTARSIYHFLESLGLVHVSPRSGIYVTAKPMDDAELPRVLIGTKFRTLL